MELLIKFVCLHSLKYGALAPWIITDGDQFWSWIKASKVVLFNFIFGRIPKFTKSVKNEFDIHVFFHYFFSQMITMYPISFLASVSRALHLNRQVLILICLNYVQQTSNKRPSLPVFIFVWRCCTSNSFESWILDLFEIGAGRRRKKGKTYKRVLPRISLVI